MRGGQARSPFWQQFFRNTGLGLFNDFAVWVRCCRRKHRKPRREQKKIVTNSSPWLALGRCGIHILPILVSSAIIAINFKQLFIGINFKGPVQSETLNIAFLQTAAKVQELLIIASLTTIVYQLTRDELIYGDGLPLGLVSAGADFTQLSFFWSPQLFGSLRTLFRGSRKYRKIQLAIFLLLAGAIALLAGPSCAVLLIPQTQDWPVGSTPVALNGTIDDFWPVSLTANPSLAAICSLSGANRYAICPSGGFNSLWSHYSRLDASNYVDYVPPYAADLSGNRYYWSIESMPPISTRTISLGGPQNTIQGYRPWMVQTHLATAVVLDQLMKDWWNALLSDSSYTVPEIDDRRAVSTEVYNPYVRVRCAPADVLSASNRTIQFPTFDDSPHLVVQNPSSDFFSNTPTNHLRFSWVPLSVSAIDEVTTGAVLQSAWSADNQSRLVIGCSVSAQWAPAVIRSDAYSFWQGWYPKAVMFWDSYPQNGGRLMNQTFAGSQTAITVDQTWLNTLTPPTPVEGPDYHDWEPSTIESILGSVGVTEGFGNNMTALAQRWRTHANEDRSGLLAMVILSIFTDGLSRTGVDKLYKVPVNGSQWTFLPYEKKDDFDRLILQGQRALKYPEDNDMFSVEFGVSGLSYSLSLAQKLAVGVLSLHIALALAHTVWTTLRRESSGCWDSTTEIMVLAQNSRPAIRTLDNTAAGIQYSSTFSKKVTVRVTKADDAQVADHLEFVLMEEAMKPEYELNAMSSSTPSPAVSAGSSVFQLQSRASTWPFVRTPGGHTSTSSASLLNDGPTSSAPLLPSQNEELHAAQELRVRIDHAYG